MNETKNEIKIDTLTTETENTLGQILQKNKIAYIGTNDQPKYVIMTYDHYQRFPGHPTGPLMEMAKTEQGVWVAIEDLIAYRFNEYGTTRSQQRHIGKIQIKDDDLYLLEIINDLPYGYIPYLRAGSMILHHSIRVEHIRTYLTAPSNYTVIPLQLLQVLFMFSDCNVHQLGT